jgi:hypothetical protein
MGGIGMILSANGKTGTVDARLTGLDGLYWPRVLVRVVGVTLVEVIMLIEAHWANGRFAVHDVVDWTEAIEAARGEIVLGAILVNILDDRHVLIASINDESDDFTYFEG